MIYTRLLRPLALVGVASAVLSLSLAQTSRSGTIYTTMSAPLVNTALATKGIKATLGQDSSGDPKLSYRTADKGVEIIFYGCKSGACSSLQIYAGFVTTKKLTLAEINSWNEDTRYTNAYLDSDSDPFLESDLDLSAGMTTAAVAQWAASFNDNLAKFISKMNLRNR